MKRHSPLTPKQLLLALGFFTIFTALTLFLFGYQRDEKKFLNLTSQMFVDEMTSSTLNMHYTIASPLDFGIYDYKPVLPGYDARDTLKNQAATENIIAALHSLDESRLTRQDKYTRRLLMRSLDNSLQMSSFRYYEEPLSPASGMQSQLPILLAEYTFRTRRDVEDYLALLNQTDEYFVSLLMFEQEKAAAGLLMPASSLDKVKKQCDTILTKSDLEFGEHFLQTTFQERLIPLYKSGEITDSEMMEYIMQNDRLLKTVMLPAYIALADGLFLLEDSSIPLGGLASKPQGADYYKYLLIAETGSYRPVPEVQKLLTANFSKEYEAIHSIAANDPSVIGRLSTEEYAKFPFEKEGAPAMLSDLQNRMIHDFPRLPSEEHSLPMVTVKAVSENLAAYCAPAFYLTAPLDDTDNNVIYINEGKSPDGLELYTTLAHEGYPGHLYQTVYSNRSFLANNENNVRQLLWYGGYQEGWALYVEFISYDYATALLTEQGRPEDALCVELEKHNRSLQLCLYSLLDIMIHYEDAPFNQVAKVLENFGIRDTASASAIYTYIAEEPCNYLKYYLGYLEILELQQEAKNLWGNDYTDLAFHTFFLNCGPSDFTSLHEALAEAS